MVNKTFKETLVRAVASIKGLRLMARTPRTAVLAQAAGLFMVRVLVLTRWHYSGLRVLHPYFNIWPEMKVVSLPPGNKVYAARATKAVSRKVGRPCRIVSRKRPKERPWQALSAQFLAKWLDPDLTDDSSGDEVVQLPLGNVGSWSDSSEDEDVIIAHLI